MIINFEIRFRNLVKLDDFNNEELGIKLKELRISGKWLRLEILSLSQERCVNKECQVMWSMMNECV